MKRTLKDWLRYRGLFYIERRKKSLNKVRTVRVPLGQHDIVIKMNNGAEVSLRAVNDQLHLNGIGGGSVRMASRSECGNSMSIYAAPNPTTKILKKEKENENKKKRQEKNKRKMDSKRSFWRSN